MNYKSVNDLTRDIINNANRLPKDIDLVVGVPRSGMLVASYIALIMNKPLASLDGYLSNEIMQCGNTKNTQNYVNDVFACKKVLIVEDSVSSGKSIQDSKRNVCTKYPSVEHIFFAAYVLNSSKDFVDIFLDIVPDPRLFEWNIFHQPTALRKMCFDIDGVLCIDPISEENDDGKRYREFILTTQPKIKPGGEIGCIVTSRLEKYREETEQWLRKNDIKYNKLVMLDATAEERTQYNLHAKFKADFYKHSDAILFIESESRQAYDINAISKKPVLCIEDNTYYDGNKKYKAKYESKYRIKSFFRQFKLVRMIYSKVRRRK